MKRIGLRLGYEAKQVTTSVPHHLRALPIAFQTIQLDSQDTQMKGQTALMDILQVQQVALIYSSWILIDKIYKNRL